MSAPTLRQYQHDAIAAVVDGYRAGQNRLLVKMPTGTGKTVMFAELIRFFPDARVLIVAHREELLDQAASKIRQAHPELVVEIEQADRSASPMAQVVVASIQTLSSRTFARLTGLLQYHRFGLVIVDEAHHAAAPTYRTLLVHLGFLPPADATDVENVEAAVETDVVEMEAHLKDWDSIAPKDRLLVGVTATPNRSDSIGLGCVFQTLVYNYALRAAVEDQWLVDIKPLVVETKTSLDAVRTVAGEYNQRELAAAVNVAVRNDLAIAAWHEHAKGRPTLAFTVDVAHAHDVADAFAKTGVRAVALSGMTPREDRRQILADYTAGRLDLIANCAVLTEGTDLPRTSCILHLKPTKSATLYEQMTGRGLRLFPAKDDCLVIDVVDLARRHSLMTVPTLYGLPPGLKPEGKTLQQLAEELEAFRAKHPNVTVPEGLFTLAQLQATATRVDPWKVQPIGAFGSGRALNWIRVGEERYTLSYPWKRESDQVDGTETLLVEPDLIGQWGVTATFRSKDGDSVTRQSLSKGLQSDDLAAGAAEAYILAERRAIVTLKAKNASWKSKPISEAQIKMLGYRRIPVRPGMTSGEASDLIDKNNAEKAGRRR